MDANASWNRVLSDEDVLIRKMPKKSAIKRRQRGSDGCELRRVGVEQDIFEA